MRTVQTILWSLWIVCFLTITGLAEEAAQVEEQYGGETDTDNKSNSKSKKKYKRPFKQI